MTADAVAEATVELQKLRDLFFEVDVRAELDWAARSPIVCELEEGAVAFAERTWGLPRRRAQAGQDGGPATVAHGLYISPALDIPEWLHSLLADRTVVRSKPTVVAAMPLVWSLPPCFSEGLEFYRGPIHGVTWPTKTGCELIAIDPDHCRDPDFPFLPSHAHIVAHEIGHLLDVSLWDRTPEGREYFARAVADVTVMAKPTTYAELLAVIALAEISGKVPSAPAVAAA